MQTFTARLVPHDPKRDQVLRTFVLGHLRFDAGVWTDVDASTAEMLRAVRQSYYDPFSPLAFEVRSYEKDGVEHLAAPERLVDAQPKAATPHKPEKKGKS